MSHIFLILPFVLFWTKLIYKESDIIVYIFGVSRQMFAWNDITYVKIDFGFVFENVAAAVQSPTGRK